MGVSELLQQFQDIFVKKTEMCAYVISSLIWFLALDTVIRTFFFKPDSLFSLKFLINTALFLGLALFFSEVMIKWFSKAIMILLQKTKDKAAWVFIIIVFVLTIMFHYKYQLFR